MASLNTIARPYAKAAFAIAKQAGKLVEWGAVLRVLQLAIQDPLLAPLLKNPSVQSSDWQPLLMSLCEDAVSSELHAISDQVANFIALLLESKRLVILSEVSDIFHQLRLKEEGVVEVEMVSAFPVTEADHARFQQLLEKRFSATVSMQFSIDESLIGGALFRSGDWVMDGSVKHKLKQLADTLANASCLEE